MRKNIISSGPIILCIYYLLCIFFKQLFEYSNLRLIAASFALLLTVLHLIFAFGFNSEWNKWENNAAMLSLPLCAIVGFEMVCGFMQRKALIGILFIITFVLTIPIFMRSKTPGCFSRAVACLFSLGVVFLLVMATLFTAFGFEPNYSAFSVLSPDGKHAANVLCIDEGALGGRTYVNIVKRKKHTVPTSGGKEIAESGHAYTEDIEIRWIDNDTIEFHNGIYDIS